MTIVETFRALHRPGDPLLLPNPWDAGSARVLAALGYRALATTSSGFAATLGRVRRARRAGDRRPGTTGGGHLLLRRGVRAGPRLRRHGVRGRLTDQLKSKKFKGKNMWTP
jgi:hypothetical protein